MSGSRQGKIQWSPSVLGDSMSLFPYTPTHKSLFPYTPVCRYTHVDTSTSKTCTFLCVHRGVYVSSVQIDDVHTCGRSLGRRRDDGGFPFLDGIVDETGGTVAVSVIPGS